MDREVAFTVVVLVVGVLLPAAVVIAFLFFL
jgi:hypothetical protein